MAKTRHKKRTHLAEPSESNNGIPKSMVIKMGDPKRKPTKALSSLVRDFRQVMQPHTAGKLRERRSNKLKDYFVMAGPLGVTNFFIFSQSSAGNTMLRIGRTPRGPTLYFRVNQYVLSRDIQRVQQRPHALTPHSPELQNPSVLVLNNFSTEKTSDKEALLTSMFQNMLPTIQVDAATSLSNVRRVMLLNRIPETGDIEMRHYVVVTRIIGTSRAVKKLDMAAKGHKQMPDLHQLHDVAQFMDDANTSDSEAEDEVLPTSNMPPTGISQNSANKNHKVKRAVKLVEVGPRLNLTLLKIEEGLCSGKTLYHKLIQRSAKEAQALESKHKHKDDERAKRRKIQEENVKRKREELQSKSSRKQRGEERAKLRAQEAGENGESVGGDDAASGDESSESESEDVEDMNDYELDAEAAADMESEDE